MEQGERLSNKGLNVEHRPGVRGENPVYVTAETLNGRELLLKARKRQDAIIEIDFMDQTFIVPDESYQAFLPEALRAAINGLNEVEK